MMIESLSPFGFQETVDRLTKSIAEKGWKMPALHNLQQTMHNFGKIVLPVSVIEICHPAFSGRILEQDDERIVAPMMPCRIAVFERSDGKTYISRINSVMFAAAFGGLIEEVMAGAANDMERIIEAATKD